jgi:hypothetical protein
MATSADLDDWVHDALVEFGGRGRIVDICKFIWKHHEQHLRNSGDLFYTWQYDMRWTADHLRRSGVMKQANNSPKGIWELVKVPSRK